MIRMLPIQRGRMDIERFYRALVDEIRQEQAGTLGSSGERLQKALDVYQTYLAGNKSLDSAQHESLLDEIAHRVWELALQRELLGFQYDNITAIMETYHVPQTVLTRLGKRRNP